MTAGFRKWCQTPLIDAGAAARPVYSSPSFIGAMACMMRNLTQPKKHANGSASISWTRSQRSSLVDGPGYSCHLRSARIQYSRHLLADRMNLSLAAGDSIHLLGSSHLGRRSTIMTSCPLIAYSRHSLSLRWAGLRFWQNLPTVCSIRLSSSSLNAIALHPTALGRATCASS